MDYFIKAENEAELKAELLAIGVYTYTPASTWDIPATDELPASQVVTTEQYVVADGFALDVIGVISKPTGEMLITDGMEYPESAPIDGYHANLRGELTDAQIRILAPLLLAEPPANPCRVWA